MSWKAGVRATHLMTTKEPTSCTAPYVLRQDLHTSPKNESRQAGCRPLEGVGARSMDPGWLQVASTSALYCSLLA